MLDPDATQTYLALAAFYAAQRQFHEAETQYRLVLGKHPTDVEIYCHLARFYAAQSKLAEAEGVYQEAIKVMPQFDS